jgi:pimeloyl-ACP methyl ester carboxylesterase
VWGEIDVIFIPPGAKAFKRDFPNAKVELLDGGHFLLETHGREVAAKIIDFLQANGIEGHVKADGRAISFGL